MRYDVQKALRQFGRVLLCGAIGAVLSGCYSMQGAHRVLNDELKVTAEVPRDSIFFNDYNTAYQERLRLRTVDAALVNATLSSGFAHIYSYCDNYFDVMGMQQRKSRVARDSIAPIAALITGVIALHNFENKPNRKEDMLAVLGLTTAASASVLDIYDEHMLFGAENIGSVEILTKNALSAHSQKVRTLSNISFDAATQHLLDNQAICSPQHILTLTREAIKEGKVTARTAAPAIDANNDGVIEASEQSNDGNVRVTTQIENDGKASP